MMRNLDFSSWQGVLTTLLGLVVVTLLAVGIRLLLMETVQQRRQRENRQINERLRTLIAAYKALGGSFTGNLAVDPTHLRDLRSRAVPPPTDASRAAETLEPVPAPATSERSRRIRDAVEAALSDVILLGTAKQVRLAARAAAELVAGRPIHTDELVISLRNFIREVLDLEPMPKDAAIPKQGPTRAAGAGSRGGRGQGAEGGSDRAGGGRQDGEGAGFGGLGAMGGGMGFGLGGGAAGDEERHPT